MKRGKTQNTAWLGAIVIALMFLGGVLVNSPQAAQPWKTASVAMAGADAETNNVAFAYDRSVLVAPYAPSKMPKETSAVEELDNNRIYLVDAKRPLDDPKSHVIATISGDKQLFYPTKVVYDEASNTAYVRGTRFERVDGDIQEIAAIAIIHVNLEDNGKAAFGDGIVIIDIAGIGDDKTIGDAPDNIELAYNGNILVFTNGASIFTYNLDHGYLYRVDLVKPVAYDAGGRINYLDVDPVSNTLTVYWNSKLGEEGKTRNTTELSFYKIESGGTMQLKKRLYPADFPEGAYLTAGSNIELHASYNEPDKFAQGSFALTVTSDGRLCQLDLSDGDTVSLALKPLTQFDALAASGDADGSPRTLKYDPSKRMVGIVKQGYTAQARKPSNGHSGRPGSVIRSLSLINAVDSPTLVVVRVGKNLGKVVASKIFADEFRDEAGLTHLIEGPDSQWWLATYSGNVLALNTADSIDAVGLNLLTQVGPRTGRIAYLSSRDNLVAINSFALDAAQEQISEDGALVVAKPNASGTQSFSATSALMVAASRATGAQTPTLSARRPCNISKK